MTLSRKFLLLAGGLMAFSQSCMALGDSRELSPGDPAPPLVTGPWIQGQPVSALDSKQVYLIEFWATWCGPCVGNIPHLNALQNEFQDKGLIVIGLNVNTEAGAEADVRAVIQREKVNYRVALDHFDPPAVGRSAGPKKSVGSMERTWMAAAGYEGLPTAFLVDQEGRIAWIGHPYFLTSEILGRFFPDNMKGLRTYFEREKTLKREVYALHGSLLANQDDQVKLDRALQLVATLRKEYSDRTKQFLFLEITFRALRRQWPQVIELARQALKTDDRGLYELGETLSSLVGVKNLSPEVMALMGELTDQLGKRMRTEDLSYYGSYGDWLVTLAHGEFRRNHLEVAMNWMKMAIVESKDTPENQEKLTRQRQALQDGKWLD